MKKKYKLNNDEINPIELIIILWDGKWKLVIAIVVSIIIGLSIETNEKNFFTASTLIKPISISEESKFASLNEQNKSFDFINISKELLLKYYISALEERTVFEEAIDKFKFIDASKYDDEKSYRMEVVNLAASIKILMPSTMTQSQKETSYWTIQFMHDDAEKWIACMNYINKSINDSVQKNLRNQYLDLMLIQKRFKEHAIEDLDLKIKNLLMSYDEKISHRIAFLEEQSAIAKTLDIDKNKLQVSEKLASQFYLRGYEAIDKEIELIKQRKDKRAFINGLFDLELKKQNLIDDKTLERVELSFNSSPLAINNQFSAASPNILSTKFNYKEYKKQFKLIIGIGLFIGLLYIFVSHTINSKKTSRKYK